MDAKAGYAIARPMRGRVDDYREHRFSSHVSFPGCSRSPCCTHPPNNPRASARIIICRRPRLCQQGERTRSRAPRCVPGSFPPRKCGRPALAPGMISGPLTVAQSYTGSIAGLPSAPGKSSTSGCQGTCGKKLADGQGTIAVPGHSRNDSGPFYRVTVVMRSSSKAANRVDALLWPRPYR